MHTLQCKPLWKHLYSPQNQELDEWHPLGHPSCHWGSRHLPLLGPATLKDSSSVNSSLHGAVSNNLETELLNLFLGCLPLLRPVISKSITLTTNNQHFPAPQTGQGSGQEGKPVPLPACRADALSHHS